MAKKRARNLLQTLLCWRYLFSHVGRLSSFCARKQSGGLFAAKEKRPSKDDLLDVGVIYFHM